MLLEEPPFPSLRKYIVPATRRVGGVLLEFATPENLEVVSGRKNFKTSKECGQTYSEKTVR